MVRCCTYVLFVRRGILNGDGSVAQYDTVSTRLLVLRAIACHTCVVLCWYIQRTWMEACGIGEWGIGECWICGYVHVPYLHTQVPLPMYVSMYVVFLVFLVLVLAVEVDVHTVLRTG